MRRIFALAALMLLVPEAAWAVCVPALSVSATTLNFGIYDPSAGAADKSTATISLQCTIGLLPSFSVALSTGGSGSYTMRRMTNGGDALNYNLYTDPNGTMIWGDGSGGTSIDSFDGLISLGTTTFTVYGAVPQGQYSAPGAFADTITVTVTY